MYLYICVSILLGHVSEYYSKPSASPVTHGLEPYRYVCVYISLNEAPKGAVEALGLATAREDVWARSHLGVSEADDFVWLNQGL